MVKLLKKERHLKKELLINKGSIEVQKKFEHIVLFDNLTEAFSYQNNNGGELYTKKTHSDYHYMLCAVDSVTDEDIERYPYMIASDFIVNLMKR